MRSSKPFDLKFVRRQDFDFPVVQKSLSFTLINEFSAVFELVISEFLVHAFIFISLNIRRARSIKWIFYLEFNFSFFLFLLVI